MPGMPASVTTATSAALRAFEDRAGRRGRVVLVIGPNLAARQLVSGKQPPRHARVFGDDQRRLRAARRARAA